MTPLGALEIGGSHLSVAMLDPTTFAVLAYARLPLDSSDSLAAFINVAARAVAAVDVPPPDSSDPRRWAIAIPGPFDYRRGVGGRHPAGKLAALAGVDVADALAPVLGPGPITFVNDATAFALGAAADHAHAGRLLALTFGSGIGSTFIEDRQVVTDDERVPPGGEVYALPVPGFAEHTIESRFGPAALAAARGYGTFRSLAEYARTDPATAGGIAEDFTGLADALAPWLGAFRPDTIVCGGGVCHAWDLFGPAFAARLTTHVGQAVQVVACPETERVALRGAALAATRT